MPNVLDTIIADKRAEVDARKAQFPLAAFKHTLAPSTKSFYDALSAEHAGFILECKKASPSKGLIREDFDLDTIISAYGNEAACISVLTDEKYFQGTFEYLAYVTQRVSQPVINKDFFIDTYQVYLARHYHADAVLLMLSVLDDKAYVELANVAEALGLDVLTEVSNEQETRRAIALNARIIGINNRNLRDLSTELATTEKLVPIIKASGHECVIISESGIYTHQQVRRLAPLVDGFLVGSSLMAEADIAAAVNRLIYGDVKICGITNEKDAQCVAQSPANYAGLIFAEKSPRGITLQQATSIVNAVKQPYVGVFVEQSVSDVVEMAHSLQLKAVQLHGGQSQSFVDQVREQLHDSIELWYAVGVEDAIPEFPKNTNRILLDCKVGEQRGGTGQSFDWQLLTGLRDMSSCVLAGGLDVDNITGAVNTGVPTLDINSGVETSPGIKDPNQISTVFNLLRQY